MPVRRHAPRSREHARAIAAHIASPAFHDAAAPVARLYLASFGRVPDYEGFEHYLGERGRGTSLADIAEEIAGSPEFEMRHGPLDDAAFLAAVERLAQVALEPGERGRWLADLAAGRMTRGEILIAISETAAFRSVTANEVFVAMAYAEALQRAPDAGELARWVAFLDAGNPRTALLERLLAGG